MINKDVIFCSSCPGLYCTVSSGAHTLILLYMLQDPVTSNRKYEMLSVAANIKGTDRVFIHLRLQQLCSVHGQKRAGQSKMEVISAALLRGSIGLEKSAVITGGKDFTYSQLVRSAQGISTLILKFNNRERGLTPDAGDGSAKEGFEDRSRKHDGPRIGIMAKPCAEFVAGLWGVWLNGCIVIPLAHSFPEPELLHVILDAEITLILATEEDRKKVEKLVSRTSAQLLILPPVESSKGRRDVNITHSLDELRLDMQKQVSAVSKESAALVIYTSGTTGRPKGVVHTHIGLGAQVRLISEAWDCAAKDRFLHCLPLHHVHGFINALITPLYVGATVDFLPKFSTSGVWQCWRKCYPIDGQAAESPITVFTGVPTMYVRLLQGYANMDPQLQKESAHAARQLRVMLCASSALPEHVMDEWESLTGHRLVERYGMTEFGMGLSNPLYGEKKSGFVGKPLPGIETKIVGEADSDVEGVGELLVKSPSMFREYWRQPQATIDSFTEDGYFKTGDTVTTDEDGYVKILGRTSVDILMVGGFKLSALEIEAVLLEHPSIAECAVFGLHDKDYGEVVCAVVVPPEAATAEPILNLTALEDWALERLALYKIPKRLIILESLPRNAMGKVNKKELRKTLLESTA